MSNEEINMLGPEYLKDKEILLEEMAKTLETVTSNQTSGLHPIKFTRLSDFP